MPAPLTEEWIEEQLKLCAKATPGPWLASHGSGTGYGHLRVKTASHLTSWMQRQADCHLIAAAREGYPLVLGALKEAQTEMDAIRYAAHMPDDYEFGLASWINQHLYGELAMLRDADGELISRSEDVEEILRLRAEVKRLEEAVDASAEA